MDLTALTEDDEDRITKVDLAHEVERTRKILHDCDGELSTEILKAKDYVNQKMTELNDQNKNYFDKETKTLHETLKDSLKELKAFNEDLIGRLRQELKENTVKTDARMSEIQEFAEKTAQKEVDRYLGDINYNVRLMNKQLSEFKDEIMQSMTHSQLEMRGKVTGIVEQFDSIRAKFAAIAKTLS